MSEAEILGGILHVAKRHLQSVPTLPYLLVYGKDGKLVRKIQGFDLKSLDKAIAEGSAR